MTRVCSFTKCPLKVEEVELAVGIPILNEKAELVPVVDKVRRAASVLDFEVPIVICDNGSTCPETISALRVVRDEGLVDAVLEEPLRGKCHALNRLRLAIPARFWVFVDSDVVPDAGSVAALYRHLRQQQHQPAVGARLVPMNSGSGIVGLATRVLGEGAFEDHPSVLNGGLFAIRSETVPMFPPLLSIDAYLTALIKNDVPDCPSVRAGNAQGLFCLPNTLTEFFRKRARSKMKIRQLRRVCPDMPPIVYEDYRFVQRARESSLNPLAIGVALLLQSCTMTASVVALLWDIGVRTGLLEEPISWDPNRCPSTKGTVYYLGLERKHAAQLHRLPQ